MSEEEYHRTRGTCAHCGRYITVRKGTDYPVRHHGWQERPGEAPRSRFFGPCPGNRLPAKRHGEAK